MRKKVLRFIVFFILFFSMNLFSCNIFSNKELDELTKKFGNNYYENIYIVNLDYKLKYETEPNYFEYFTTEELSKGVEIKMREWNMEEKNILIWSIKRENG